MMTERGSESIPKSILGEWSQNDGSISGIIELGMIALTEIMKSKPLPSLPVPGRGRMRLP
jgi:hypothetical protein